MARLWALEPAPAQAGGLCCHRVAVVGRAARPALGCQVEPRCRDT